MFEAFRVEVTAHAASEEMSLYATMLGKPDLREEAQHSVSEHKEIEDFLTELYEMDFASTGWLTRFRTMKDRYRIQSRVRLRLRAPQLGPPFPIPD